MHSARSKAQSEPEFLPVRPVPARPSSSYDPSAVRSDAGVSFDSSVVQFVATQLGVDLEASDNTTSWIVRDCLLRLYENDWIVEGVVFRHVISGERRSTNEIVETHRELVSRVARDLVQLRIARENPHYRIQEAMNTGGVSLPALIECVFENLKIDQKKEFYLTPVISQFLTSSQSCLVDLEVLIAQERVLFLKFHFGLLFCVECKKLADGICQVCSDCLCAACHRKLHSHGARVDHPFVFFDQCVCAECSVEPAIVRCIDCCDLFCSQCYQAVHKNKMHYVQFATQPRCLHCRTRPGEVVCFDCDEVYCLQCSRDLHKKTEHHNRRKSKRFDFPLVRRLADLAANMQNGDDEAVRFASFRCYSSVLASS